MMRFLVGQTKSRQSPMDWQPKVQARVCGVQIARRSSRTKMSTGVISTARSTSELLKHESKEKPPAVTSTVQRPHVRAQKLPNVSRNVPSLNESFVYRNLLEPCNPNEVILESMSSESKA